jgi:hypothetical protein
VLGSLQHALVSKGGRRPKMTPAKLRLAMAAMGKPETNAVPRVGQLSLRRVERGYLNERGKPYAAKSVASMYAGIVAEAASGCSPPL